MYCISTQIKIEPILGCMALGSNRPRIQSSMVLSATYHMLTAVSIRMFGGLAGIYGKGKADEFVNAFIRKASFSDAMNAQNAGRAPLELLTGNQELTI